MHKLSLPQWIPTPTAQRATVQAGPGNAAVHQPGRGLDAGRPPADVGRRRGRDGAPGTGPQVTVDASRLGRWDSVLPAFLFELAPRGAAKGAVLVADGAPEGLRRLLAIALAVPPRTRCRADRSARRSLARIGLADPALVGRHRRCGQLHRRGDPGAAGIPARPGEVPDRGRGARVLRRRPGGAADRHADRAARRLHPGLRRRQRARSCSGRRSTSPTWSRPAWRRRWGR